MTRIAAEAGYCAWADGKLSVVLRNVRGTLAVYRVRTSGQLKRLRRWPAASTARGGRVSYYRHPYVGEGADGARRSAQIDREEADGLATDDPRRAGLLESAARCEQQAEAIERQRAWTPPPPRPQPSGGRMTAWMLGGALLGVLLGWLLPGFLVAVFSGERVGAATALTLLGWVECVPLGGVLGSLWGLHRARRRPRPPIDMQQRPNQVIRRRQPGE